MTRSTRVAANGRERDASAVVGGRHRAPAEVRATVSTAGLPMVTRHLRARRRLRRPAGHGRSTRTARRRAPPRRAVTNDPGRPAKPESKLRLALRLSTVHGRTAVATLTIFNAVQRAEVRTMYIR